MHAYLNLKQCFEENAKRHDARALMHEANGHPDYAIGSRRKAAKWRAKIAQYPPLPEPLATQIEIFLKFLSFKIMNGL